MTCIDRVGNTTIQKAPLRRSRCCAGARPLDRVLYAMDYPYQFVPEEVDVTDELPIDREQLQAFYQTNAERVFKL